MGKIGILEVLIMLMISIALVGMVILSISKLVKSKLTPSQKIGWILVMIFFNILGIVIFLFYHDNFLLPKLRANS